MSEQTETNVSGRDASPDPAIATTSQNAAAINPGVSSDPRPGLLAATGAVLGYARVSTDAQVLDRQLDALRDAGCQQIWTDVASGALSSRPELDALLMFARPTDSIVVLSLDRLGRDTRQLLAWVDELRSRGIHLRILQLGVDTATPAGEMVLTVIASLAQMERQVLSQRVREGLAAARARGRVGGRPASLNEAQQREVLRLRRGGRPTGEVASLFGCSERTVRRVTANAR